MAVRLHLDAVCQTACAHYPTRYAEWLKPNIYTGLMKRSSDSIVRILIGAGNSVVNMSGITVDPKKIDIFVSYFLLP